jgi:hypothetical protein
MPLIEAVDLSSLKRLFVFQYLPTPVFQRWRRIAPQAEWINCWGTDRDYGAGIDYATRRAGKNAGRAGPDWRPAHAA